MQLLCRIWFNGETPAICRSAESEQDAIKQGEAHLLSVLASPNEHVALVRIEPSWDGPA